MTKKLKFNFEQWWNDGENKFKKLFFLFSSWWVDGNSKLIKAICVFSSSFYFCFFLDFI